MGILMAMRAFAALLLLLCGCGGNPPPPFRDVGDFCAIPRDACGKRLVDEHGHVHVVVCPGERTVPPCTGGGHHAARQRARGCLRLQAGATRSTRAAYVGLSGSGLTPGASPSCVDKLGTLAVRRGRCGRSEGNVDRLASRKMRAPPDGYRDAA